MQGLVFRNGTVSLDVDIPRPIPEPGEAEVRVTLAGICATDIEIAKGYMNFEGVLGHEFVGRVHLPGDGLWDRVRVVGGINCSCGVCSLCRSGRERHCPNRSVLGIQDRDGAFTESLKLPLENLVRLPDFLGDEDAVFAEPLAAVLRIAEQAGIESGTPVAVVGDGRMGLLTAAVGEELGWVVTLVGRHPEKMERSGRVFPYFAPGEMEGGGFDVAVDFSGSCEGIEEALRLLRPQGVLVLKTTTAGKRSVDLNRLVINEISLIGSRCGDLAEAVAFMVKTKYRPSYLVTAVYPLEEGKKAFQAAQDRKNIKVLLQIQERSPETP